MSNPFQVINHLKLMSNQLKLLGNGTVKQQIFGQDARGFETMLMDFSKASGAWATGDLRIIVCAVPAVSILPLSMQTQSHAFGTFMQGSCTFEFYLEGINQGAVASLPAQIKFQEDAIHTLRGMNGAPITLFLTQGGVVPAEPTLDGFNGAVATVGNKIAVLSPYGIGAPGGI